jgi:hypothetical protein
MATTGTTTFDLQFTEIAEEAWEQAGREIRSGYDLRTARRSMDLMLIEWQNRGINMWTLDSGTIPLVAGTAEYTLPADTVDLMEHSVRTGSGNTQTDINLSRVSVSTYAGIPNKLSRGKPLQIHIRRELAAPVAVLWPVPDNSSYTLVYWRLRRMEDTGRGVETPDVVYRFYPALVAGLAYHIAKKVPELAPRVQMLKQAYEEQWAHAASEDRERATWRLVPDGSAYR